MPISGDHFVPIGVIVLVLIVLPSCVGFAYSLKRTPKEVAVAYGVSAKLLNNPKYRLGYTLLFAGGAIMFGTLALLLIWAGLGGGLARHLLKLL